MPRLPVSLLTLSCGVACSAAAPSKEAEPRHPAPPPASAAPVAAAPSATESAAPAIPDGGERTVRAAIGDWGTAHPALVAAAAPNGGWLALCQARGDTNGDGKITVSVGPQGELGGDAFEGYLITDPGSGERIDSFAGNDPSGRFVAFVRAGRLFLLDTQTRSLTDLSAAGADVRDDQSAFVHHRAVAFDDAGERVLYMRPAAEDTSIVVRSLATGAERSYDPGDGELWRADFDDTGKYVIAKVAVEDTNRNGRLDWLVPARRKQALRCPSPVPRFPVWEHPGDRPTTRLIALETGLVRQAPELVFPIADALIERRADKSLVLREAAGATTQIAAARCEGRILHADPARGLILSTCRNKTGRHSVNLTGKGVARAFPLEMGTAGSDHSFDGSPRLVPIHAGADTALFDLEDRALVRLRPHDRVVATRGPAALILRGDRLLVHRRPDGESTIPGTVDPLPRVFRSGAIVYVSPIVVNLETGAGIGHAPQEVSAVSSDGRVLVPASGADAFRPATGPLRWLAPAPLDPDTP